MKQTNSTGLSYKRTEIEDLLMTWLLNNRYKSVRRISSRLISLILEMNGGKIIIESSNPNMKKMLEISTHKITWLTSFKKKTLLLHNNQNRLSWIELSNIISLIS